MDFQFDLRNCGHNNSQTAIVREATRLACIAWCLQDLGHTVRIPMNGIPQCVRDSPRFKRQPFCDLDKTAGSDGAIRVTSHPSRADVVIKTTVKTHIDRSQITKCAVYVAHEYDPTLADNPRLLPVPFLVSDAVLSWFSCDGMEQYLRDDLEFFRRTYQRTKDGTIGFFGFDGYSRRANLWWFKQNVDIGERQLDLDFYEEPPTDGLGYLETIREYELGFLPFGDTPKSNRHAELALLGITIITTKRGVRDTPDLTPSNCIMLDNWGDNNAYQDGIARLAEIRKQADQDYRYGWSPRGQAQLIVDRLTT